MKRAFLVTVALGGLLATTHARAEDETVHRMRSPALFGSGIAVASVGLTAIPVGVFLAALSRNVTSLDCFRCGTTSSPNPYPAWSVGFIGGGATLLAGGIIMSVLGAQRRVVEIAGGPSGSTGLSLRLAF